MPTTDAEFLTQPQDTKSQHELWTHAAGTYQEIIGRCTNIAITRAVDLVHAIAPFTSDSYVLDNGAGTGNLTVSVKRKCPAGHILATDIATGMLEKIDALHLDNVTTQRVDAVGLSGLQDDTFSHVMTSFALQFIPDAPAALRAMHRVLAPGGTAAMVIWGPNLSSIVIHIKACKRLKPDFMPAIPRAKGSWEEENVHRAEMEKAGFRDVTVETIPIPMEFTSASAFGNYWFGTTNPIPSQLNEKWVSSGGNVGELRRETEEIARDEYNDGRKIFMFGVIGIGKK